MNEQADKVRRERLRLEWSIREASVKGGISNTWWGKFEDGKIPISESIVDAVSKAFDWPEDWASLPDASADLQAQIDDLRRQMEALGKHLTHLVDTSTRRLEAYVTQRQPKSRGGRAASPGE